MIIHVTDKNLILRVGIRFFWSWRSMAAAAKKQWDHGYITIYGLVVERW
jgi:hypothetical protein